MVYNEETKNLRYGMYALAAIIIFLNILAYIINPPNRMVLPGIILVVGIVAILMITFIHPKNHQTIAIPLIVNLFLGIILSIVSIASIWNYLNTIMIFTHFMTQFFAIIISLAIVYIFVKPRMYHVSDIVVLGFVLVHTIFNMGRNIFQYITINTFDPMQPLSLPALLISAIIVPFAYLALILLYVLKAKRLSELEEKGDLLADDPSRARTLTELTKLYRDGHLTWNEYEEKKRLLKEQA